MKSNESYGTWNRKKEISYWEISYYDVDIRIP